VSPAPQHGTTAGDAFLAIQKLARSTGGDVQEQLTLYALEGLLTRVAASRNREDFVLKGGVLLAAFSLRRPTKDIDLQATGIANDADDVLERVREIAAISVDPICPAPSEITLPRLVQIGQQPVHILGYPLPMVIAEKTVTALERGEANTRWRDFADVLTISSVHKISASELTAALQAVAVYRGAVLRPLLPALIAMPETAQAKWATWRRRQAHAHKLPEQFADALSIVAAFTDPVLNDVLPEGVHWNAARQKWEQEKP
jgi:Nucleotidyl transferase AbiEii toxin, Type IV TA system